jgi:hypothetical protein
MSIVAFRSSLALVAVSLCAGTLNGCGSDSTSTKKAPDGGSTGGGAGAGTHATGGAAGRGTGGAPSSGGAAGDASPPTGNKSCGGGVCQGTPIATTGLVVNACCPNGDTKPACGLDLGLLSQVGVTVVPPCQAKHQPGEPSAECPDTSIVTTLAGTFTFKGCCRPDHQCGGLVNSLDVTMPIVAMLTVDLGCVSAGALPDAGPAKSCTPVGAKDAATD